MKQTKKLTRAQKEFLEKVYKLDCYTLRLVRETKDEIIIQNDKGEIKSYSK